MRHKADSRLFGTDWITQGSRIGWEVSCSAPTFIPSSVHCGRKHSFRIISIVADGSLSHISKELLALSRRSESVGGLEDNFLQDDSHIGSNYVLAEIIHLISRAQDRARG